MLEIFEWLLILLNGSTDCEKPLNEKLGSSLIMSLIENQFTV